MAASQGIHSLTEVKLESVRGLEDVGECEELVMPVDSGAGATVIGEHQVKAVAAIDPRPDIKYEVADGSHIPNLGESCLRPTQMSAC